MPSYVTPKRGVAFITYVALVSQANTKLFQSNPTIAAGDWKLSKDGGALNNLATLPSVEPASSVMVKISLSATEMEADNVTIVGIDASGSEWCSLVINIQTSARQIDDLSYPTVSGRSTDVSAGGEVGIDWANVGSPNTTVNLSGTTVKTATDVETDTADIQGRLPAALVSGRIDSNLAAAGLQSDAVTEIQSGLATQSSVDDLPTNSELSTALAAADDATLAAIAALNDLSAAEVNAEVDTALADYDAPTKAELDAAVAPLATAAALSTVAGYLDTEIAAILAAVDTEIGTLVTNVAAILADTGTDGVVISQTTREAIADAILGRSVANVEATATIYTIAGLVLAAFESAITGTSWQINRTDGSTSFATRTVATDAGAEPIVSVT
jgi:hypothetical protein